MTLAGGETVPLRKPHYAIADPGYGPLDAATTLSPRVASPMIGIGLIEAIHEADILARADPEDRDGDGISGQPALVRERRTGLVTLGRFGWKAQNPSVRQQVADAFAVDIGISTSDLDRSHGDCTAAQTGCLDLPDGVQPRLGAVEAPDPVLDLVTFYSSNLAVPARRKARFPETLRGKRLFHDAGCAACHAPKFVTRRDATHQAQAFQLIWPYSDFLLHDMGEGLADGQQVGEASGREWRTPPLWGIGLTKTVSGHSFLLHDGRPEIWPSHTLARRRSGECTQCLRRHAEGRPQSPDHIPGVPLMRLPFASLPLALGLIFLGAPAAAQEGGALSPRVVEEAAVPSVMTQAVDGFIIPGYRDLAQATNASPKRAPRSASHLPRPRSKPRGRPSPTSSKRGPQSRSSASVRPSSRIVSNASSSIPTGKARA